MYAITYFDVDSALFICGHGAHELGEGDGAAVAGLEGVMNA